MKIHLLKLMIVFLFFCTVIGTAKGQILAIKGKVIDDAGKNIPFCAIEAKNRLEGVFCDENGAFSITLNTDTVKRLIFYTLGYEEKELNIEKIRKNSGDSITVMLHRNNIVLNDISIVGNKAKAKQKILGKKGLAHDGGCYMQYEDEVAIFLQANHERANEFLRTLVIYITNEGVPSSVFEVNVYGKDSSAFLPGKQLTQPTLAHATSGNEWVSIDVGDKNIPIAGGIFIGVKWISDGNSQKPFPFKFPAPWCRASINNAEENLHYGQVLGNTCGYGIQSRTFIKSHATDFTWLYDSSPYNRKRASLLGYINKWFNPMIYATYTIRK